MADTFVYAGAAQWPSDNPGGLYRRRIGNGGWEPLRKGLPEAAEIRAIAIHPEDPKIVYAGTQDGPYRTLDRGDRWERLGLPDRGAVVWSILFDPANSRTIYAGTAGPTAVYRSDDDGDTWRRLPAKQPDRCQMGFATRVIRMAADPSRPGEIYAGLEVGGIMRSLDGGETWNDCTADLLRLAAQEPQLKSRIGSDTDNEGMLDSHSLCVSQAKPGTVFLAVRMGLFRSADRGATWEDMSVGRFSPLTYARDVQVSHQDPKVLYTALSPAARSEDGSLYRSDDLGETWKRFDHDVAPRATMMTIGLHRHDPNQVYCASRSGQVFGTRDGGKTWEDRPLPAGVKDIYAVACG